VPPPPFRPAISAKTASTSTWLEGAEADPVEGDWGAAGVAGAVGGGPASGVICDAVSTTWSGVAAVAEPVWKILLIIEPKMLMSASLSL